MRRVSAYLALAMVLAATPALAQSRVHITVRGDVAHPGRLEATPGTRLAQAAVAAGMHADAYPLGAAWLEPSRLRAQRAWKAGLVFDLHVLADAARLRGQSSLTALSTQWLAWVQRLPVTGRRTGLLLDPRALELAHVDPMLEDGGTLIYPPRPDTVRVVGAVRASCVRAFVPMRAALDYLDGCARADAADPDWLYVVEPDGQVTRRGIGAWNRDAPIPVAPGAVLYVPLGKDALKAMGDKQFNADMARFLATQPLPEAAP